MVTPPPVVDEFARVLATLGWVNGLLVAGSLAAGDYLPGVSDLDLVALARDRRRSSWPSGRT